MSTRPLATALFAALLVGCTAAPAPAPVTPAASSPAGPASATPTPTTTPSATASGQDAAAECATVRSEMTAITADLESAGQKVATDLPGAIGQLETATGRVEGLVGTTSDPELRTRLQAAADAMRALVDRAHGGVTLADSGELLAQMDAVRAAGSAVDDYCRAR